MLRLVLFRQLGLFLLCCFIRLLPAVNYITTITDKFELEGEGGVSDWPFDANTDFHTNSRLFYLLLNLFCLFLTNIKDI